MTWGDAMKDIKEKPTAHMPRSNATGEIPKAALKKAWAEAKEKSRTMLRESTSTQGDGDYTTAQDTSSAVPQRVRLVHFPKHTKKRPPGHLANECSTCHRWL